MGRSVGTSVTVVTGAPATQCLGPVCALLAGEEIIVKRNVLRDFMVLTVCTTAFVGMTLHVTVLQGSVTAQVDSLEQPVKNHVMRVSLVLTVYINASVLMQSHVTRKQEVVNVSLDTQGSYVIKSVPVDFMGRIVMKNAAVRTGRLVIM